MLLACVVKNGIIATLLFLWVCIRTLMFTKLWLKSNYQVFTNPIKKTEKLCRIAGNFANFTNITNIELVESGSDATDKIFDYA